MVSANECVRQVVVMLCVAAVKKAGKNWQLKACICSKAMLPRQYRLRLSKDIKAVYKGGKRLFHPLFRLVVLPTVSQNWRAAIVVSTQVSKKAVDRNRIKRRLRAIVWERRLQLKSGYDLVIVAQPPACTATAAQLAEAFDTLSKRLHLFLP